MALNIKTFRTRALTAIIFAIIMLVGLLAGPLPFILLVLLIHAGCWFEYQKLVAKIDPGYQQAGLLHRILVMIAGVGILAWLGLYAVNIQGVDLKYIGKLVTAGAVALLLITECVHFKKNGLKNFAHSLFGLLYISVSLAAFINLYFLADNGLFTGGHTNMIGYYLPPFPIIIIATIWINDTMAYIVGSFIGKTPLSSISPKKTWEGTVGGIILAVIVSGILARYAFRLITPAEWVHLFILAAIIAIAGTYGDLLESKLKRLAGVKDSGSFMPGHGGFLDRFDSLLLAVPFAWLYVHFVMKVTNFPQ